MRFFVPRQDAPGLRADLSAQPVVGRRSARGTEISSGLELAHTIATRGGARRPAVVLVSDLDDDPGDVPRLASIVLAYRRDKIPLRIVGLNPSTARTQRSSSSSLGPSAPIVQAGVGAPGPQPRNRTPFPWVFVVLVVAAARPRLPRTSCGSARLEWEPAR